MTEQELLAVLDMSEDEQFRWCWRNTKEQGGLIKVRWYFLEDLAFRLRDEAIYQSFVDASIIICQRIICLFPESNNFQRKHIAVDWFATRAKPIHWIIAALIAKGKK